MESGVLCTMHPWCVRAHDHEGECARTVGPDQIVICSVADRVLAEAPPRRPAWDERTPDPNGWNERRRYR